MEISQFVKNVIAIPSGSQHNGEENSSQLETVKKTVNELKKQNLVLQSEITKKEIENKDLQKKLQQREFDLKEVIEENQQLREEYNVWTLSSFLFFCLYLFLFFSK